MAPPGRRKHQCLNVLPLLVLLLLSTNALAATAVLGIDFGTEYFKAAVARAGNPIEIVLSKDSKRREAATIAFKPARFQTHDTDTFPERLYGGDAVALSARFPTDVYPNLKTLLGRHAADEAVKAYASRYPGLDLEPIPRSDVDKSASTVGFKSHSFAGREEVFMVEELLAMQLKNVKSNAEAMMVKGTHITDAVITYPSFYTCEEKRAIELAADLAGLRTLAMVSDGLAVGINYATHRTFDSVSEGARPEHHLVYDMGAGSATATVLKFQGRTVKGLDKRNQTIQEVVVVGTGFDQTLGGDAFNDVIVEDMLQQFVAAPQVQKLGLALSDVRSHGKSMARIWKDAERIRQLLSANAVSTASFEGLYDDDINFKYSLTREKFEELAQAHAARVALPLSAALESAGLGLHEIDSVILHGGAIRTPFVYKELEKSVGNSSKLKANVNADEAAVMGAAFKAASLSPSFRVKDIRDADISGSVFSLTWTLDNKDKSQKLFTPSSLVGGEKQVPVKVVEDVRLGFTQTVNGNDRPVSSVDATNLTKSVAELKDKFGCAVANISSVFTVRLSPLNGLPEIISGSVGCEVDSGKTGGVIDNVKGLFGFGSKKDGEEKLVNSVPDEPSSTLSTPEPVSDPTSSVTTLSASASPDSLPDSSSAVASSLSPSKSAASAKATTSLVSIPLALKSNVLGLNAPPAKSLPRLRQRITQFDKSDRNAILRAEALNNLEAFTYRARDYLEDESFIAAASEKLRTTLDERLTHVSEWLYGGGVDATTQEFRDKMAELRALVDPVLKRRDEAVKRPAAVKALQEQIENLNGLIKMVEGSIQQAAERAAEEAASSSAAATASTTTSVDAGGDDLEEDPYGSASSTADPAASDGPAPLKPYEYTKEDLLVITTKHDAVSAWLAGKLAAQDKLALSDEPALLVADLESRGQELQKVFSDTILKTVQMPDFPGKAKAGKKAKPKEKKSKSESASTRSSTSSKPKTKTASKKDEL